MKMNWKGDMIYQCLLDLDEVDMIQTAGVI